MEWIDLARDGDGGRALMNAVRTFNKMQGITWLAEDLLAAQVGFAPSS